MIFIRGLSLFIKQKKPASQIRQFNLQVFICLVSYFTLRFCVIATKSKYYLYRIHFINSRSEAFFPYIKIPVRYTFAASHAINKKLEIKINADITTSQ